MIPGPHAHRDRKRLLVWWVIWVSMLTGLIAIYFALHLPPLPANPTQEKAITGLVGLVPLFVSIIIRWLVLPRYTDLRRALPMFIAGLALAESCGLLGIFFGGPYRDDIFLLGALGLAQFVPLFARKLLEPAPTGYIPNN